MYDLYSVIKSFDTEEQNRLLGQFGLEKTMNGLDGIPIFLDIAPKSEASEKIFNIIKKFTVENETDITDNEVKRVFNAIIKGLPEFTLMISKQQHITHSYSVDIHSFEVLQKSMNNNMYKNLSDESKVVLKMTALLHDLGKKEGVITTGHAIKSAKMAECVLRNFDFSASLKARILKLIKNHHWFESYNKCAVKDEEILQLFGNDEDILIAEILAKSDFESVNQFFHLFKMNPEKQLTQTEFDIEFAQKTSGLKFK